MKIVVLGASGGCGRHLVEQGLQQGHQIVAVMRSSSKNTLVAHASLSIKIGDFYDVDFLHDAMQGADVVCSALGLRLKGIAPWHTPEIPDFLSRTTPVIIEAMKRANVRRIVAISSGGVGDSMSMMPSFFKVFIKLSALQHAFKELGAMEQALLQSSLDVCICRPTGLTDEPATGRVQVATRLVGRASIPRADVAAWMLDALRLSPFPQRTPVITVTGV